MPQPTNQEIKRLAYRAVITYEQHHGRDARVVEKDGYDIRSIGNGEERHIEVKGSTSSKPTHIGMEPSELNYMQRDDRFYLYIVRNVGKQPSVHQFNRNEVLQRFQKIHYQYVFRFSANDFGQ